MSKSHPINELPERPPADSSSWDRSTPEVPSSAQVPVGAKGAKFIELGMGGTSKPMGPFKPTDTYCEPYREGEPDEKFVAGVVPAVAAAPQFVDVSSLIEKARGS